MQQIDISEARSQFPALLEAARHGAEIIITENDQPVVKLAHIGATATNGTALNHDSIAARVQAEAEGFLDDYLPDRFCTGSPQLDAATDRWRVPVLLSYTGLGPVGQVGEIAVSAATEKLVSHTVVPEMKAAALRLYEKHRDAIEAPL